MNALANCGEPKVSIDVAIVAENFLIDDRCSKAPFASLLVTVANKTTRKLILSIPLIMFNKLFVKLRLVRC